MNLGYGMRPAIPWVVECALLLAVLGLSSGCDVLDRGKLRLVERNAPDGGIPPDAGDAMEGGVPPVDSGMQPIDSGMQPIDSGHTSYDSGPAPADSSSPDDAAIDASADAEIDAGCGGGGCVDFCPNDDAKTETGECGCGVGETNAAACSALRSALRHRYRFGGTGTVLKDDAADADGTVVNAALDGSSGLSLAGGTSNQYVELPDGIVSALTDATFEAWVTWQGGGAWQRIFDFGSSSGTNGDTYIFVTPQRGGGTASLRATLSLDGSGTEVFVDGPGALSTGGIRHVVLVVDDRVDMRLYVDGVLQSNVANTTRSLSGLSDTENWLGRSHFSADPEFAGTFHEFRIYNAALTAEQVAASFALGADAVYLEEFRGGLILADSHLSGERL
jgi:hypothetical protein